ncbi:uncharacterized protein KGF55_001587 [Candida pseudojiufengensis]|uniref:uncharacterized protein n=1 Tax=Candida pseudojiufengensis TaxID=497109 RepID=UPI0022258529|nr:uncharacterized protein KGF55_001587 [Candida pseudojiufengensis]KAI5965366.1 hypothetical protein KGF55_001587 [Candida pseudojiufengensis]
MYSSQWTATDSIKANSNEANVVNSNEVAMIDPLILIEAQIMSKKVILKYDKLITRDLELTTPLSVLLGLCPEFRNHLDI